MSDSTAESLPPLDKLFRLSDSFSLTLAIMALQVKKYRYFRATEKQPMFHTVPNLHWLTGDSFRPFRDNSQYNHESTLGAGASTDK